LIRWLGFLLVILAILLLSRKNLGIAMFAGAIILELFFDPNNLLLRIWMNLINPSTILLATIVGLIPIISGVLNETGQIDELVRNMRIGRRTFLIMSPALIGLLPMPGGALLSAPLVNKAGAKLADERKAAINIWFRHILYLVYPLSADLIVSTRSAGIGLYQPIPYLSIILFLMTLLGFFFFLPGDLGEMTYEKPFSLKGLLSPLLILLIAPILDLILSELKILPLEELATLIAVLASLILSIFFGKLSLMGFYRVIIKSKPWNFAFMIVGIMVFLGVFRDSGILSLLADVPLTLDAIFGVAFLFGFITGRIVTPAGIIFPIYLVKFGTVSPLVFSLIYFGIFLGYVMTPVHPCVSLTLVSLKVDFKDYIRTIGPPIAVAASASLLAIHFLTP